MTDSDLKQAVQTRIDANQDLRNANLDVDADAEKNEVKLSGTVATQAQRTQAVELAKAAHAGVAVRDEIKVDPSRLDRTAYTEDMARDARERAKSTGDKIGNSVDDAWIHTKIAAKLMTDSDTPSRKINVDVVNGAVTLRGAVNSEVAKREAERIARETDGVKKVTNLLKIQAS